MPLTDSLGKGLLDSANQFQQLLHLLPEFSGGRRWQGGDVVARQPQVCEGLPNLGPNSGLDRIGQDDGLCKIPGIKQLRTGLVTRRTLPRSVACRESETTGGALSNP